MKISFSRLMEQATRLTRRGELQHAVAVIREALGGKSATEAAPQAPTLEAAHASPPHTPPLRPAATATRGGGHLGADSGVIDVEVREIPTAPAPILEPPPIQEPVPAPASERAPEPALRPAPVVSPAPVPPAAPAYTPREAPAPATPARFIAGEFACEAGTRAYKLYLPPGPLTQPVPLVVMLHGCTQNPDDFATGTGMNAAALARGFVVLYPAQSQSANLTRCWNWFKPKHQQRGSGEPAVIAGMTREVMRQYPVDPQRVYVAGLSAGGAMAAILGDAYPDLYAAVGVHSGLPTGAASDMATAFAAMQAGRPSGAPRNAMPPPTIVFHGDQDSTVHPVNGERVLTELAAVGVPERARQRSDNGREYTRHVYRDAAGHAQAEHWVVHGAGHAWSGGQPGGSYTDAQGPDATEAMLRFFFAHTLSAAPATQTS